MNPTVLFIHGGWVAPACWDRFVSFFEARGYRCPAPAWPGKDRSIEAIRADPSPLAGLGIGEIVDHYDRIVRALDEPPILIGHSFGGLFVRLLLDRGPGAAGIVIDTAPPKGVFTFYPTSLVSLGRILLIPFGWRKVVRWTFTEFRNAFVHTMPSDEARAIWDTYISPARTELRTFPGRTHWIIAQNGWEEVAQACVDWIGALRADAERTPITRDSEVRIPCAGRREPLGEVMRREFRWRSESDEGGKP